MQHKPFEYAKEKQKTNTSLVFSMQRYESEMFTLKQKILNCMKNSKRVHTFQNSLQSFT